MVVDSSALIAILHGESDAVQFARALARAKAPKLSAANLLETAIVVERRFGAEGGEHLDLLIARTGVETVAFSDAQIAEARGAYRTYGRGRHRAALNFGDCFAYALAKVSGDPLLYKGDDFSHTDIESVLCA